MEGNEETAQNHDAQAETDMVNMADSHEATTTPILQEEQTHAPNNSSVGNGREEALPSSQPTDHSAAAQHGIGPSGLFNTQNQNKGSHVFFTQRIANYRKGPEITAK